MGIWFNASPNAKQYCVLGGEGFVLKGDEVDIGSVFLCGVMWCRHRYEEADRPTAQGDPFSQNPGPPDVPF